MKPPPFDYADPTSLPEALSLLATREAGVKILAGGQSLMPLLNFRQIRPRLLLDVNRVTGLDVLRQDTDGLKIGATVRQRELERHPCLPELNPLLAEALPLIGHFPTRNRGTVCGSLAHADPAAELPAVAVTQDALLTLQRKGSQRIVAAGKFFRGPHQTLIEPDEMLTQVSFPAWHFGDGWGIEQVTRRPGDFALVGVVAVLSAMHGSCTRARVTVFGAGEAPQRCVRAESLLEGERPCAPLLKRSAAALQAEMRARNDLRATAEYRRLAAGALAYRALLRAAKRAGLWSG
jgi:aerobic carbon-monoxide dehydrogenase medium subunit